MSFSFQWPRFSEQFHTDAIAMLNSALNKGTKPPVIADRIEVVELEMGTQPPELEVKDIGELTTDQFRGIFRLTYAGDAHIVLKTKVQVCRVPCVGKRMHLTVSLRRRIPSTTNNPTYTCSVDLEGCSRRSSPL